MTTYRSTFTLGPFRSQVAVVIGGSTAACDGLHLATSPQVLRGT